MDARRTVLDRIRAALGQDAAVPEVMRDYRRRGEHPPGDSALLDLFAERLRDYRATVVDTTEDGLAEAIAGQLPSGGSTIIPAGLPAPWRPADAVIDDATFGPAALDGFAAVLTACAGAVAETGTIALDGSADQGRRAISLVPDRHLCVVRAPQVVQTVPELLARLDPSRPLTLISGPSATSDIELNRVEGVHGPRTLIVLLVRAATAATAAPRQVDHEVTATTGRRPGT